MDENHIPYVSSNQGHEIWEDAEAAVFVLGVAWVINRMFRRHHVRAGIVLLVSSAAAFTVMVSFDMTSGMAYVFWALVAVALLALAKVIS